MARYFLPTLSRASRNDSREQELERETGCLEEKSEQLRKIPTVVARGAALDGLEVVLLAEDAVVVEGELLARAELPLAGVAGEAGEVVDAVASPPHPVRGADAAAALGAPRAEVPAGEGKDRVKRAATLRRRVLVG